jgi:hypothetical protein
VKTPSLRATVGALCLVASLSAGPVQARGASLLQLDVAPASSIRAAMLLNFAKFVEWPPDKGPLTPLTFCVLDDPAVADALEPMARGRSIERRQLEVRRLKLDAPVQGCHLLYASGLNRERTILLLTRTRSAPILTVSDFEGFAPLGGVIHFFVQGGKMRFAINPAAAQRGRLKLSSQLLGVATIVKDDDAH